MDTFFDFVKTVAVYAPMLGGALFFVIAAVLKTGKEKGSLLILLGAICLLLTWIVSPIVYIFIVPKLIDTIGMSNLSSFYMTIGLILNFFLAVAMALMAIGTLRRKTSGSR